MCVCARTRSSTRVSTSVFIHEYVRVYARLSMHVCVGVHARANMCVCVRLRAFVWAQAVQQGCAEQRPLDGSDEAGSRSKARGERMSADALGVVVRILDPGTNGRIAIDSYVDFLFNTSAQQSPAAAKCVKIPSPNATHADDGRQHSPSTGPTFPKSCTPPNATQFPKTHELAANALFAASASSSRKTLDPWARQNQLDNVIVPVSLAVSCDFSCTPRRLRRKRACVQEQKRERARSRDIHDVYVFYHEIYTMYTYFHNIYMYIHTLCEYVYTYVHMYISVFIYTYAYIRVYFNVHVCA